MHFLIGKKQSPEHIAKRIASRRKNGTYTLSSETREKIRQANLGKKYSLQTKLKHSQDAKRLGLRPPVLFGKAHPAWKGDKVTYFALHSWISRKLGKPKKCNHCGITTKKCYHWANISRKYKRDLTDWIRLCSSCHMLYDLGKITLK